jgi:hypothetical protein
MRGYNLTAMPTNASRDGLVRAPLGNVSNIVTLAATAIKVCKYNEAEFRAAGEAAENWGLNRLRRREKHGADEDEQARQHRQRRGLIQSAGRLGNSLKEPVDPNRRMLSAAEAPA